MRCAIYVRVSREDLNLDNQIYPLKEYAERMKYDYEIFEEKESTRKTRPIQYALYNRLLKREFDVLLVYKLDRWARSTKEMIEHIDNLVNKGITVYSLTENLDLSSAMGRAMFHMIGVFAQLERDINSERTKAGQARARARGKKIGRHPRNCKCGKCKQSSNGNTKRGL